MQKPSSCQGCPLHTRGSGFVPPYRGAAAGQGRRLLFIGESPGRLEIIRDEAFVGPAGGKLNHLLYQLGYKKSQFDIHNTISCRPPGDALEGAWYEDGAVAHCRPNLEAALEGLPPGSVIVPLGGAATRRVLGIGKDSFELKNFHGTVSPGGVDLLGDPQVQAERRRQWADWGGLEEAEAADREAAGGAAWGLRVPRGTWVVPTFHPAHLIRGAHNLTGVVLGDLAKALEIAEKGWHREDASLVVDPSPEWFLAWAEMYLAAVEQDPWGVWLSVDVETPDKGTKLDEGELKTSDRSYKILRWNFACHPDEGVTVPGEEPYNTIVGRILRSKGPKCFWNKAYDCKRIWKMYGMEGLQGDLLDFMDAWHVLHSDVPKGLGFVAPYYCGWGPWKHLSQVAPGVYGACDGFKNHRCAFGIAADLKSKGQWEAFYEDMHLVDKWVTSLSCRVGLKVDRAALEGETLPDGSYKPGMRDKLRDLSLGLYRQMQELVPEDLRPMHPNKEGWVHPPPAAVEAGGFFLLNEKDDPLQEPRPVVELKVLREVGVCETCEALEVHAKHRCKDERGKPDQLADPHVVKKQVEVSRYFVRKPFNPGSWQQVLAYILACGHKPGKNKGKPTTNRETIERLADARPRNRKDERARGLYLPLLDFKDVKKVLGNYVEGTLRRLDAQREEGVVDDRLHATVTNNPSTLRTSYVDPNLQNVVADRRGEKSLSAGFREAIIAEAGCVLIEADWSGIEAVNTGWKMGDGEYIRLAWLGVHDFLCSHAVGQPADRRWSAEDLVRYFAEIKKKFPVERDQCKRTVHGTHYLLTPFGMAKRFRKLFPSMQDAEKLQRMYYEIVPKLGPWQHETQELAHAQHYLGGRGAHPYAYRHEFWNVKDFEKITWQEAVLRKKKGLPTAQLGDYWYAVKPGEDAKRAVAFYPQSILAGTIRKTSLRLFMPDAPNYIGEAFFGKTPLRAIIHDSFLLEVPERLSEWVIERVLAEMLRPMPELPCPAEWGIGPYLRYGAEVKVGKTWARMEKLKLPGLVPGLGESLPPANGAASAEPEPEPALEEEFEEEDEWEAAPAGGPPL